MRYAHSGRGLFFAFFAFIVWGTLPLYWRLLIDVHPLHILAFRIVLSLVLVGGILVAQKNFVWIAVFREPRKAVFLVMAGLLLCLNWGVYIWAVNQERTIEASIGYYISPLISVVLGLLFFKERLRPVQWAAVAIAFSGVLVLAVMSGVLPWVPLVLAMSFGFYGLFKKKFTFSAVESLGTETLASLPVSLVIIFVGFGNAREGSALAGLPGLAYLALLPAPTLALLALCGAATMLPLYFFGRSTKLLPLSTVGFIQFVGPTLQFLIGVFVFREAFPSYYFAAFVMIWIAVVLYIISLKTAGRLARAG